jgi:ATP-dependent Lon protease
MQINIPDKNYGDPGSEKEYKLPLNAIIVPIKDIIVFPTMVVTVFVHNLELINAAEKAAGDHELIILAGQKDAAKDPPPLDNLYDIGTSAFVLQVIRGNTGADAMILVEGISRVKVEKMTSEEPYLTAKISPIEKASNENTELQSLAQELKSLIKEASGEGKTLPPELFSGLEAVSDIDEIADLSCSFLTLDLKRKQELLGVIDHKERLLKIKESLVKEIQLLRIRKKIRTDISKEMNKSEKNFLLKQELKAIKKELGEETNDFGGLGAMNDEDELKDLKQKIKNAKMPPDVEKIANNELERLKKIFQISPEYSVARTYIEWLCDMPWNKSCPNKVDVKVARKILDEDHYGLEKIKERILEYLAVCQLKDKCGATILCFVGPPGVGKTSLGKSIARAMGRAFIHTSLGGIRDEADIRGHRRTYVGAMPGRVIQSIKRAGCNDPVFMLDEIDKIGKDFQGDPASALVETLDPEQNNIFTDHYLDVPFDLSKVFFILTANFLDPIPPALLDRMEIIELSGYTEEEKLVIAKKYLLPKQNELNGLEKRPLKMTDEAISNIVRYYTSEAGLRELERQIASICRKVAKDFIEKKKVVKIVSKKDIEKYLGVEKYSFEAAQREDTVGVATGLAWTPTGGDIIFIETSKMKGSKNLILTGQLGDVMQESARAALTYIRSHAVELGIKENIFEKLDLHIHVPEGATPKDGPSAGITICTALISLLTGKKVHHDLAMTGEITLTGRILPIGGLKEKLLAAKRAQIKTIIIPDRNRKDLTEIPKHMLSNLDIKFAKTIDDVIKIALIPVQKPEPVQKKIITKIIPLPASQKNAIVNYVRMKRGK